MPSYFLLSNTPLQTEDAATGTPASGFTLSAFLAGTTTPASMYSDNAGTAIGTSVTTNSAGYPQVSGNIVSIWLDSSLSYKLVLEDASSVTVWESDNVSVLSSGASVDTYDSMNDLISSSSTFDSVYVASYYDSWQSTLPGPSGGHYRHKTGATNASPSVGSAVAVSTIGTGVQAGYCWDASGAEWRISKQPYHVRMFGARGLGSSDDSTAVSDAITAAEDGCKISAEGCTLRCDTKITMSSKNNITIYGGDWEWNHTDTNMIALAGTLKNITFERMNVSGDGTIFASQGAIGCPSGTVTENWLVDSCTFDNLPFGVYFNADSAGSHKNPTCRNSRFSNIVRNTSTDASGIGNGLVFASQAETITNGLSENNTFDTCGRHSLYVSAGGNVNSVNDYFVNHRSDGSALVTTGLAAVQIARNSSNVTMINPVFESCTDLALAIQAVQLSGSPTYGANVRVVNPIFKNNLAGDYEIGNDSPTVNGRIDNISIINPTIIQRGLSNAARGLILSGKGVIIENTVIDADLSEGSTEVVNIIRVDDIAATKVTGTHDGAANAAALTDTSASWTVSAFVGLYIYNTTDGSSGLITANTANTVTASLSGGTDNDWDVGDAYRITTLDELTDIHIRSISGSDAGTLSRGVAVDAGILTSDIMLALTDINIGSSSKIFESSTVPQNPNYYKINSGNQIVKTAFTASFTDSNSEINRCDKYAGKKIFSLSGGAVKPFYATGPLKTDTWVDAAGTVTHTPT